MSIRDVLNNLHVENMTEVEKEKYYEEVSELYFSNDEAAAILDNLVLDEKPISKVELGPDKEEFAIVSGDALYLVSDSRELPGSSGHSVLRGGDSANILLPSTGSNRVDGGDGFDVADFDDGNHRQGGSFEIHKDGSATIQIGQDVTEVKNVEAYGGTALPDSFHLTDVKDGMLIHGADSYGGNDSLIVDVKHGDGTRIEYTPGKLPDDHEHAGKPYDAKIIRGDDTLYVSGVENISLNEVDASQHSDASTSIPLESAIEMLANAQIALNENYVERGEASMALNLANHENASDMIQNLIENGVENLDINISEADSVDEHVVAILEAAKYATQDAGLEMPSARADSYDHGEPEQISSHEEDYGIV